MSNLLKIKSSDELANDEFIVEDMNELIEKESSISQDKIYSD